MTVTARQRWTLAPRGRGTLATLSYEAGAGAGAEVGAGAGAGTSAEAGARAMEAAVGLERMGQVVDILARVHDDPLEQVHEGYQSMPPAATVAVPPDAAAPGAEDPA